MAVDFNFNNIVTIIANEFFGYNTSIAGLAIMLVVSFIAMAILANIKAPVYFALVPMIILSVIFAAMGIMDQTLSFLIIIMSAVLMAVSARKLVGS